MKGRLEMGLKLDRTSRSRFDFFRRGLTDAVLRGVGTSPLCRDLLMRVVRKWTRDGEQAFSRGVGMGSREQVVVLDLVMIFRSVAGATSVKLDRVEPIVGGGQMGIVRMEGEMLALMSSTLVLKKVARRLQCSGVAVEGPELMGLRRRSTVANRVLGFPARSAMMVE